MVFGVSLATYTLIHVVISVVGIASGLIVLLGMLSSKPLNRGTAVFLATTVATSATGFGFPFEKLLPSHIVGMISLVVLALAIFGRYVLHLAGAGRWIYVVGAVIALYLNIFVAVVQAFAKLPALKALAPTQKEPPFMVAQLVVLLLFIVLGALPVKRFRVEKPRVAAQMA